MDTARNSLIAIIMGVLFVSSAIVGVGGVVAQEEPTETPAGTEISPSSSTSSEESTLVEIDPETRVLEAEWSDGEVTFVVERDSDARPSRDTLVVTDASINLQRHEAREIPQSRQQISPGRHEVTFDVENPTHAAVTVGTSRGLVSLSPGSGGGWWSRAPGWFDVRLGALAALLGVPAVGIGIWGRVSSRSVDVEAVDLSEGNDE